MTLKTRPRITALAALSICDLAQRGHLGTFRMIRNFMILGTQRTGSTALYQSLNCHPEIACGGEWLQYVGWYKKLRVTQAALAGSFAVLTPRDQELIAKEYHRGTRWLGFKLLFRSSDKWLLHPRFSPALWLDRLEAYFQWLSQRPDIHVIHIVRKDAMEWLKSKYLSSATGLFTGKQYPDGIKVNISLTGAVKRLQAKNWIDTRLAALSHTNPYLRIYYEDFSLSNYTATLELVEFLQCDSTQLAKDNDQVLKKQSKRSAENYISNYDQLLLELQGRALLEAQIRD